MRRLWARLAQATRTAARRLGFYGAAAFSAEVADAWHRDGRKRGPMTISREWTCQRCQAEVAVVLHGEAERSLSCPACWANAPGSTEPDANPAAAAAPGPAAALATCAACGAPILPGHAALDYCVNCGLARAPVA